MDKLEFGKSKGSHKGMNKLVWIRGGGDLATGVAIRLLNSGFSVICSEMEYPSAIRLSVSFAQAVYSGSHIVETYEAQRCDSPEAALALLDKGLVPVLVCNRSEEEEVGIQTVKPFAFVEATLRKKAVSLPKTPVPLTIGLGPGFKAGEDVMAVIETNRGHDLGRVIWQGFAEPDTGIPGSIGGYTTERVIHAPASGVVRTMAEIGQRVSAGSIIAQIELEGLQTPVLASIEGILRGLIYDGYPVKQGLKMADIDPRCEPRHCHTVSDKARAIGGGVLEAILRFDSFNSKGICL